jgi:hypothetical protein
VSHGRLEDNLDVQYRRIGENWPVFAFAKDLGTVKDVKRTVFALGHVRDPAISHRPSVSSKTLDLSLLYLQAYPTLEDTVSYKPSFYAKPLQKLNLLPVACHLQ